MQSSQLDEVSYTQSVSMPATTYSGHTVRLPQKSKNDCANIISYYKKFAKSAKNFPRKCRSATRRSAFTPPISAGTPLYKGGLRTDNG
jgi:hypothetical protein